MSRRQRLVKPRTKTVPTVTDADYVGRGSGLHPPNRFEQIHRTDSENQLADTAPLEPKKLKTEFFDDQATSIVRRNESPDLPFRYSVNPYRGCEHGCSYCYARPTHETLGWNSGIEFETKISVKRNAALLLRQELSRPSWVVEPVTLSGVTDCYQPAERVFRLTRSCLEVLLQARQPFSIVTKNALILRDRDLLVAAAARSLVHVFLSVTTLDEELARELEPRTSSIAARLSAIQELARAEIPVGVLVAPVIPGLNDHELPAVLQATSQAGARHASWQLLRLPLAVSDIFLNWLERHRPEAKARVEQRIRDCREGSLNQSAFGQRMRGSGPYAEQLRATFKVFAARFGLDQPLPQLDVTQFRRPRPEDRQKLFAFAEDEP